MSGWTTPPSGAVPPNPGAVPPAVGMHHDSQEEQADPERSSTHRRWAREDAEAAQHVSTAELRRDADRARDQVNRDVVGLRHKFGLDHEHGDGHGMASRPLASVRRYPLPVAVVAAGATTAALIGLKLMRDRRRTNGRDHVRVAARQRGKAAQRRFLDARDTLAGATSHLPHRGRSGVRRLMHK